MKHGNRIMKLVYLTESENEIYTEKAKNYAGFSNMVRKALPLLDDYNRRKKMELNVEHNKLFQKQNRQLSAIGNNINQIAHQINIYGLNGQLPEAYVTDVVIPAIDNLKNLWGQILLEDQKICRRLYTR